jgi:ADP-heptose:LPS heptosyltransferase
MLAIGMIRRNILIFHQAALGDFVLSWPLAIALGRLHPQSRIVYVTASSKGKLAEKVLGVESQDIETGWGALFFDAAASANLSEGQRKILSATHAIYDFCGGAGSIWAHNVAAITPDVDLIHLPTRPSRLWSEHATDCLLQSLSSRPATQSATRQIVRSIGERGISTRRTVGDTIVIHPGSGSRDKNPPLDRFIQLATDLRQAGRIVRFVIGEAERDRWPREDIQRLADSAALDQPGDYCQLHAILAQAGGFIGNDSGPTHLAAICGVPTLALFISTNPAVWRPLGPSVTVAMADNAMSEAALRWAAGLV